MSNTLVPIQPEYVYVTVPAEYICVYHRILAMLADYGEEMLKDCNASCTDRNSGVIECFNMFNAAVAARKLGKDKLAETLIKYIKAKINQIYQNKDNSTSFVFPVDETGQLKAFVSCGERPKFEINPDDMILYEHKFDNGFDEHFRFGPEEEATSELHVAESGLDVILIPSYHKLADDTTVACADLKVYYNTQRIDPNICDISYYFDGQQVIRFNDVRNINVGNHTFEVIVNYEGETKIKTEILKYENAD